MTDQSGFAEPIKEGLPDPELETAVEEDSSNCNTVGTVDFGEGPVKLRCTQTGNHKQCKCEVFLNWDDGTFKADVVLPKDLPTRDSREETKRPSRQEKQL